MLGMLTIDYTITLGNLGEMALFVIGGVAALATLKTTVTTLKSDVADSKKETKESIAGLQSEIKKIGEVLINQADQNRRIIHLEDDVRELRHGEGFVRGSYGIDREYP